MQIDHCLILAAGFGTRMGTIGKKLPKVLWPVFEKSLLELQVRYARSLGAQKITINLHHMADEIEAFCMKNSAFEGVRFLRESPEILDIGGAIHNLAAQKDVNYSGKLLVLNADQFFYLRPEDFHRLTAAFESHPAVIFSYWVNSSLGYNALSCDGNRRLTGIVKNQDLPQNSSIETYTGNALVDLGKLKPVKGVSKFFESVCNFADREVATILLENVDYWDFGTLPRYWETMNRILSVYRNQSTHPFLRFLVNERALKTWKIDLQNLSYHSRSPGVINLSLGDAPPVTGPAMVIGETWPQTVSPQSVYWNELSEKVTS